MTVKKTLAALALIAPLTFVAACGSGDSADEPTSAAPTTVTSEISSEDPTTTETTTEEETTEAEQTEETPEPEAEPEPEAAEPPAGDPLAQEDYVEPAPVQGGAASEADRAEIEGLVHGIYEADTFHQFLRYIPENTCHEVIAEQGGADSMDLAGIPDQPLAEWDYYVSAQPHIASITDVQVDGDRASAVVTAVSAGQSETRTQRYLREDGRWKFCN